MSKELLFRTLNNEETERAPWVPFAGVHAGALIGATATEVLKDEDTSRRNFIYAEVGGSCRAGNVLKKEYEDNGKYIW